MVGGGHVQREIPRINRRAMVHNKSSNECIESPDQIKRSMRQLPAELRRVSLPLAALFVRLRANKDRGHDKLFIGREVSRFHAPDTPLIGLTTPRLGGG